jgi:hypothetical protein
MEWFKFYGDFAHDPRVQMLDEALQRRLVMLLCLHGSGHLEGLASDSRDAAIAFALRISGEDWLHTRARLAAQGLLDAAGTPCPWAAREKSLRTALGRAPMSSTERVRRHREARRQAAGEAPTPADETPETPLQRFTDAAEKSRVDQSTAEQKAPDAGPRKHPCPAPRPQRPTLHAVADTHEGSMAKATPQSFEAWLGDLQAAGELPVPGDDAVFAYARDAGLGEDLLHLAWCEFAARYRNSQTAYADWRAVFRKAVRENWLHLWCWREGSGYVLTTLGQQAREVRARHASDAAQVAA